MCIVYVIWRLVNDEERRARKANDRVDSRRLCPFDWRAAVAPRGFVLFRVQSLSLSRVSICGVPLIISLALAMARPCGRAARVHFHWARVLFSDHSTRTVAIQILYILLNLTINSSNWQYWGRIINHVSSMRVRLSRALVTIAFFSLSLGELRTQHIKKSPPRRTF